MGLLDVLNGMQNGPRGQRGPSTSGGGMSPIMMGVLGLLAYKAIKSFGSGQSGAKPAGAAGGSLAGSAAGPGGDLNTGGGLGDLMKGGLGGLLAGGAAGGVLSGGLNDLLKHFQQNGQGDVANSWIGTGTNKAISPNDLANALGAERISTLMAQTGMSRDELIAGLSQQLPEVVDQLSPEGRVPTEQEMARLL
jgi:uncharacterized protein YidB (DUF937 family)